MMSRGALHAAEAHVKDKQAAMLLEYFSWVASGQADDELDSAPQSASPA